MFFEFFFVKHPNKFFACKISNKKCLRSSTFNFCKNKNFFRPIWNIAVCENVFIFWYSNNISNFKFRIFIINFLIRINICVWFYINRLPCFLFYDTYCSIYYHDTHFWYCSHILKNLFLKVLIDFSAATDFLSLFFEYTSIEFCSNWDVINLL